MRVHAPGWQAGRRGFVVALGLWWLVGCTGGGGGDDGGTDKAPTITTQPADTAVTAPANATFSVAATGTPAPTFQWQTSPDGVTFSDVAGATAASYTFATTVGDDGRRLRVRVSNSAGSVDSRTATLTVGAPAAPRFAYASNINSWNISGFSVSGTTGALTQVTGSPYRPLTGPLLNGLALHPSGNFAYVSLTTGVNGGLFGYAINGSSGQLTAVAAGILSSGSSVGPAVFHPNGRFVYASRNALSGIEAYAVDTATGLLQPVAGSPFAAGTASRLTLGVGGTYVYQLQNNSDFTAALHAFAVDATTGVLTPVPGSPYTLPAGQTYAGPFVHPSGHFLYLTGATRNVVGFAVQAGTGALTTVPGSPYAITTPGTSGADAVFESSGRFVYFDVHSAPAGAPPKTVYGYGVDATSGALTPIAGGPFGVDYGNGSVPCGLTSAGAGYLLQGGAGLAALAIDAGTGALSVASMSALSLGGGCGVTLDPDRRYAYVSGTYGIFGYRFDATNGALTPLAGSPWTTGGVPSALLFR